MNKKMLAYLHLYGLAVMVCSIVIWIVTFIALSFSNYHAVFYTNLFYEHYFELGFFITGLLCFMFTYNKVRIQFRKIINTN